VPFRSGLRAPPDPNKILREADDVEGSEEYNIDEVISSYKSGNRVLYLIKWLGWPKKKDWTAKPFDNFSVGGQEKLSEPVPTATDDDRQRGASANGK
jgi:hypothetical protein